MRVRLCLDWWRSPIAGCEHAPRRLPVGLRLCRVTVDPPSVGWRLWLYTPGRTGRCIDLYVDRRGA
jgi:hypothetical protein